MSFNYRTRSQIALLLLVLIVGVSQLFMVFEYNLLSPAEEQIDLVTRYRHRFGAIRRVLPTRGLVGYLGDEKTPTVSVNGQYYLAQYALAPLVLAFNNAALPFVVGNFHDPKNQARLFDDLGLTVIADFGDGLKLFHRQGSASSK